MIRRVADGRLVVPRAPLCRVRARREELGKLLETRLKSARLFRILFLGTVLGRAKGKTNGLFKHLARVFRAKALGDVRGCGVHLG